MAPCRSKNLKTLLLAMSCASTWLCTECGTYNDPSWSHCVICNSPRS